MLLPSDLDSQSVHSDNHRYYVERRSDYHLGGREEDAMVVRSSNEMQWMVLPEAHRTNVGVVDDRSMLAKWAHTEHGSLEDA